MERHHIRSIVSELSAEQRTILRMIANGTENKAIAQRLNLSLSQVRTRISDLLGIFGAKDRAHLTIKALRAEAIMPEHVLSNEEQRQRQERQERIA